MSYFKSLACFLLSLTIIILGLAEGFSVAMKCPNIFSYCTREKDCHLGSRLRHNGKDFMSCIYNASNEYRIGVCCTDVAEDLYLDLEIYENFVGKELVRTTRQKRQVEETSGSADVNSETDLKTEELTIAESPPEPSPAETQSAGIEGRAEHPQGQEKKGDEPLTGVRMKNQPPRMMPPRSRPMNHFFLPGPTYTERPRRRMNPNKRRKIIIPSRPPPKSEPQPPPKQEVPQSKPKPETPRRRQQNNERPQEPKPMNQQHSKQRPPSMGSKTGGNKKKPDGRMPVRNDSNNTKHMKPERGSSKQSRQSQQQQRPQPKQNKEPQNSSRAGMKKSMRGDKQNNRRGPH